MRILAVSNYYPPYFVGGYELGCRDIVETLRDRGHEIQVLTSTYGAQARTDTPGVDRSLKFESDDGYHPRRYLGEILNRRNFRAMLKSFRPELVYFWNQGGLPGSLVKLADDAGIPYAFYLSDPTFLDWRTDSLWRWWCYAPPGAIKAVVKSVGHSFLRMASFLNDEAQARYYHHRQFTSEFIKRCSRTPVDPQTELVIPWGVDLSTFTVRPGVERPPTRILYVGRIEPEKGVRTAIQAMRILRDHYHTTNVSLTIVGGAARPDFMLELHNFVAAEKLEDIITFVGKIDRARLPAIYHDHDILVFPSEWGEPFAITPLEAMASGLVVVGTTTGGSAEIFEHEKNAVVFTAADAADCARGIHRLLHDHALYFRLREQGRRLVEARYSLSVMVDAIEQHLQRILQSSRIMPG